MTESGWLAGDELWGLLRHAYDSGCMSARRQLFYAVAACRLRGAGMPAEYLPILDDLEALVGGVTLPALRPREHLNDRLLTDREADLGPLKSRLAALGERAAAVRTRRVSDILGPGNLGPDEEDPRFDADFAVQYAVRGDGFLASPRDPAGGLRRVPHAVHLLRDLVGNPFRPVTPHPDWLTSTVLTLARQMYDSRDFTAMPILADALQDADCEDGQILAHCRGDGPHVRGCWVVDLVLGKE